MTEIKIDGMDAKNILHISDFKRESGKFLKFLKENTHSGKVAPQMEIFKGVTLESTRHGTEKTDTSSASVSGEKFHWVMSTFDLDRDFERIDPNGWDLKNYRKNPIILWSHDYKTPAIGYAENITVSDKLEGDIVFNDKNSDVFGWGIGQRVKNGVLRSGSVGFRVDEIEFIDHTANPNEKADLIYRKQELLEFSICNVPANPFALNVSNLDSKSITLFERIKKII